MTIPIAVRIRTGLYIIRCVNVKTASIEAEKYLSGDICKSVGIFAKDRNRRAENQKLFKKGSPINRLNFICQPCQQTTS